MLLDKGREEAEMRTSMVFLAVLALLMMPLGGVFASDVDDGIEIDSGINDDLKLDNNNRYIVTRAKTRAKAYRKGKGGKSKVIAADGTGNISIGAGTDLKGATIVNLSDNKGSSVVSD